jgi:hypothetical protein
MYRRVLSSTNAGLRHRNVSIRKQFTAVLDAQIIQRTVVNWRTTSGRLVIANGLDSVMDAITLVLESGIEQHRNTTNIILLL